VIHLFNSFEVVLGFGWVNGLATWFPIGWAN